MDENPESGGEPMMLGQCTECEKVYPLQQVNGDHRPIGTDGECECGNDEFDVVSDS